MAWRGGHVNLQREPTIFLKHLVVDVLNGHEPRHAAVVDVVCLVVEHGQFFNLTDDFAEVGFAVGGLADGFCSESIRQKIIAQVIIIERWVNLVAQENPVDVGQENVPGLLQQANIVLDVKDDLKIIPPIAPVATVGR